jgi:hypothetical protein
MSGVASDPRDTPYAERVIVARELTSAIQYHDRALDDAKYRILSFRSNALESYMQDAVFHVAAVNDQLQASASRDR